MKVPRHVPLGNTGLRFEPLARPWLPSTGHAPSPFFPEPPGKVPI